MCINNSSVFIIIFFFFIFISQVLQLLDHYTIHYKLFQFIHEFWCVLTGARQVYLPPYSTSGIFKARFIILGLTLFLSTRSPSKVDSRSCKLCKTVPCGSAQMLIFCQKWHNSSKSQHSSAFWIYQEYVWKIAYHPITDPQNIYLAE